MDPAFVELGAAIRDALVIADRLRLLDVAIGLDAALNALVARDRSGAIEPVPFEIHDLDALLRR